MPDNYTGILIDPATSSITLHALPLVESGKLYQPIAKLLGCDLVDIVPIDPHDEVWIDDEGLLKNPNPLGYFAIDGRLLAGRGLILGAEGDHTASTRLTIEEVEKRVRFIPAELLPDEAKEPRMEFITDPDVLARFFGRGEGV